MPGLNLINSFGIRRIAIVYRYRYYRLTSIYFSVILSNLSFCTSYMIYITVMECALYSDERRTVSHHHVMDHVILTNRGLVTT